MSTDIDMLTQAWRSNRNTSLFLARVEASLDYALQPIVDIRDGSVQGYEALLRGVEALDFSRPCEIFDFAAEIACLPHLEALLHRKAIAKFARLADATKTRLFLNIDIRTLSLARDPLAPILHAAREHDLSPRNFCLEIPELDARASEERLHTVVAAARDADFSFAIADFGQGHSQLRLLYQYDPGVLKIDRFFITALEKDARKRLFVSSVVDLAHVLGIQVVAEGVETPSELRACRDVGCDLVQGYLVARPFTDTDDARTTYPEITELAQRSTPRRGEDADLLRRETVTLTPIRQSADVAEALEIFRANPTQSILPVLDARDEPRGIIRESDLKSFLYLSYGRDLLINPTIDNHLKRFVRPCAIADVNAPVARLIDIASEELSDGVVITDGGRYLGCLLPNALLKLSNEARLRIAQDQNPLSKLPGNAAISDHVTQACGRSDVERAFCYLDFDNFKPFNDAYGFRIGDRALMMMSDLLKRRLDTSRNFVGHIGGDDFFVGLAEWTPDRLEMLMRDLRAEFARQVESLYQADHRRQGYIVAEDRAGRPMRYPLLTCSIAVLHIPKGLSIDNLDLLSNHIARLKKQAKTADSGLALGTFGSADGLPDPVATPVTPLQPSLTVV